MMGYVSTNKEGEEESCHGNGVCVCVPKARR